VATRPSVLCGRRTGRPAIERILGAAAGRGYDGVVNSGRTSSLVIGVVILAVGLWYFADRTLGLDLPRLNWNDLWPIALIVVGAWIIAGPYLRRR
jgi:hypothetical protein